MARKSISLLVGAALLRSAALPAQQDSLLLREVTVDGYIIKANRTFKEQTLSSDSLRNFTAVSLGDAQQQATGIFVKGYGSGGIATLSLRGTSAQHTRLYWNNLDVSSPTLGLADMSTVPLAAFDQIQVQYGFASLSDGSGGLGGSIRLQQKSPSQDSNSLAFRQMEARNQLNEYRNVDEEAYDGNDDYQRNVVVRNYSETITMESLSAGLNVGLGWRIANSWELQLPVGLQYHLLQSSGYRAQAVSSFYGQYDKYGVTLYNIKDLQFASDQVTENNSGTLSNPSFLGFQAGLQLRYRLSKRWHLYAGGRMEWVPELKAAESGVKLDEFDQDLQSLYNLRDSWDWQMLGWQAGLQFYF